MSKSVKELDFRKDLDKHIHKATIDKYVSRGSDVFDFLEDDDALREFAYGLAIKYLRRFYKRGSKEDLLKAGHCVLTLYERC